MRAGALLLLLCLAFIQLIVLGPPYPGTNPFFVWPRFAVIVLVIQILCFLVLARHAVFYIFRQRRMPWSTLISLPLLLVSLLMFYAASAVQQPYYVYRLAQNGRVYMLTEAA